MGLPTSSPPSNSMVNILLAEFDALLPLLIDVTGVLLPSVGDMVEYSNAPLFESDAVLALSCLCALNMKSSGESIRSASGFMGDAAAILGVVVADIEPFEVIIVFGIVDGVVSGDDVFTLRDLSRASIPDETGTDFE